MKYTQSHYWSVTGPRNIGRVHRGYTESDDFGSGLAFATCGGLDAPPEMPSGASTALPMHGSDARARIESNALRGVYTSPACTFRACAVCGGRGDTVHVTNA